MDRNPISQRQIDALKLEALRAQRLKQDTQLACRA
jgi:hypothetical protein